MKTLRTIFQGVKLLKILLLVLILIIELLGMWAVSKAKPNWLD